MSWANNQLRVITCVLAFLTLLALTTTAVAVQKKPKVIPPARTKSKTPPTPPTIVQPELKLEKQPADQSVGDADIAITANVRARSLLFETVPNPTVTFPGKPDRNTVWEAERENLPTPVQPGVTYRNIGIRLKITSLFRDIDRIVAEALGEVPVTSDPSNTTAPTQTPIENSRTPTPKPTPSRSPQRER